MSRAPNPDAAQQVERLQALLQRVQANRSQPRTRARGASKVAAPEDAAQVKVSGGVVSMHEGDAFDSRVTAEYALRPSRRREPHLLHVPSEAQPLPQASGIDVPDAEPESPVTHPVAAAPRPEMQVLDARLSEYSTGQVAMIHTPPAPPAESSFGALLERTLALRLR